MTKYLLRGLILAVFLTGCAIPSTTKSQSVTTYNTSSGKNTKSTLNYPGSVEHTQQTQTTKAVSQQTTSTPQTQTETPAIIVTGKQIGRAHV